MEDITDGPSTEMDPYATLQISENASAAEVKAAYKRLALLHHPDKAPSAAKESSKRQFQEIVTAYAILSDERRRARFDATGNTSESLDIEDNNFNWLDFFHAQWSETVTVATISSYKEKYQGSDEERRDVIAAYKKWEGNMTRVFQQVELCNVLDDEERFRKCIDEEIQAGNVENYDKYRLETEASKKNRRARAEKEAREAEERFAELDDKSQNKSKMGDLAALIKQRQQSRATNFLDDLEAKYAANNRAQKGGQSRKRKIGEPSEEAFQENAKKAGKGGKKSKRSAREKSPSIVDDEDEEVDLDAQSEGSGGGEYEDAEPEQIGKPAKPAKKRTHRSRGKART